MTETQQVPAFPPAFLEPSYRRLPPPVALAPLTTSPAPPVRPDFAFSQRLPSIQTATEASHPPRPHPHRIQSADRYATLNTYTPPPSSPPSASYPAPTSPCSDLGSRHGARRRLPERNAFDDVRSTCSETSFRSPVDAVPRPPPGPLPSPTYTPGYASCSTSFHGPLAPHRSSAGPAFAAPRRTETVAPAARWACALPVPGLPPDKCALEYRLMIRQQPMAARACGFGERDRRVIDPPPIVQLVVRDRHTGAPDVDEMRYTLMVVHCTLWNEHGDIEETAFSNPERRMTRRLMGQLVSSPCVAKDEYDVEGCFFCFPDLSCRTNGRYRLRFVLMRIDTGELRAGGWSPIVTTELSEVFTVYTAKDFPGMRPSSALTRALKLQGCNIQVKKGNEKALASRKRAQPVSEDDDEVRGWRSPGQDWKRR